MKKILTQLLIIIVINLHAQAQTNISITIDDVPNTRKFKKDNYQSFLLNKLDSAEIPIAIFVNEGLIYKTEAINRNFELLNNWVQREYITVGNHSFSHSRYSEVGYSSFKLDIEKGEYITRELTNNYNKSLQYFRFPYNDLGKDSIQHTRIDEFLKLKEYTSTPFTIESSDWMFNYVYEHYLNTSDFESASKIGDLYVEKTLEYFAFFESLSEEVYERKINQIYLCHDNTLNANYLIEIIDSLKDKGYNFISLEKSLEDEVYQQEDNYYKKWGISWFYRWMPTQEERIKWMKKEPNNNTLNNLYTELVEENKNDNK